jgi:hypothetical protein
MAVTYGTGTQYQFSDTVTPIRSLADYISIIDPDEVNLLMYLGDHNESKFHIKDPGNHKVEWFESVLRPRSATLNEGLDTTETAVDVASGHGKRFHVGDVWRTVETNELILVTAHDGSDTVTTVIRNWGAFQGGSQGTASGAVTNGTELQYLFTARREGADSTDAVWTVPDLLHNFSQIMHHQIKVTKSEMAQPRYGMPNRYKQEFMAAMGGAGSGKGRKGRAGWLQVDLENTFFYGQKVERTSATVEGGMGGFKEFVTTNVTNASSAYLTLDMIEDIAQAIWVAGAKPTTLVCNYFQSRLINSWFGGSVQTERSERTGGVLIDKIQTRAGMIDVLVNRQCPASEVFIFDRDHLGWITLPGRDWQVSPLAIDGDIAKKDEIVCEKSFVLRHQTAHGYIHTLATT